MAFESAIDEQYGDASNLEARIALHRRFSTAPRPWHTWVRERIGPLSGLRVLELGCGSGALWDGAEPAGELTLSDVSPGMVASACGVVPTARGVRCDLTRTPFDDGEFDVVIANHVLYHVAELPAAFPEIRRVLKGGGRLFAATNGVDHMRELEEAAMESMSIAPWRPRFVSSEFWLETGRELLSAFFPEVVLHGYCDGFLVTETAPLVAYVLSLFTSEERSRLGTVVPQFEAALAARLADSGGVFRITKSSGLFESRKRA